MSQKYPQLGDDKNFLLLTGELLFQPKGQAGYINLGPLTMHQITPTTEKKTVVRSMRFSQKRTVREDIVSMDLVYVGESNEFPAETFAMRIFGTQLADVTQAAVTTTASTKTIAGCLQRRSYDLGIRNATEVSVTAGETPAVAGTDYVHDPLSGMIYIIDGGTVIGAGGTPTEITVSYKCPAITAAQFKAMTQTSGEGHFRFIQTDAQSADARAIHDFDGTISIESADDFSGETQKAKFRIHPSSQPLITMPPVA